jgi:hypothetical protein
MARTAIAVQQTVWDCRFSRHGFRLFNISEPLQPEALWVVHAQRPAPRRDRRRVREVPALGDGGQGLESRSSSSASAFHLVQVLSFGPVGKGRHVRTSSRAGAPDCRVLSTLPIVISTTAAGRRRSRSGHRHGAVRRRADFRRFPRCWAFVAPPRHRHPAHGTASSAAFRVSQASHSGRAVLSTRQDVVSRTRARSSEPETTARPRSTMGWRVASKAAFRAESPVASWSGPPEPPPSAASTQKTLHRFASAARVQSPTLLPSCRAPLSPGGGERAPAGAGDSRSARRS